MSCTFASQLLFPYKKGGIDSNLKKHLMPPSLRVGRDPHPLLLVFRFSSFFPSLQWRGILTGWVSIDAPYHTGLNLKSKTQWGLANLPTSSLCQVFFA